MNFPQHFWPPLSLDTQQDRGSARIPTIEKKLPPSQALNLDLRGNGDTITDNNFKLELEGLNSFDRNEFFNNCDRHGYPKLETKFERSSYPDFTAGVFTVGDSGKVKIDFPFDGGNYRGKVAIFSLNGMDEFVLDSEEFIQKAVRRSLSNSHWGYIVRDRGKTNLCARSLTMGEGDRFGIMLISNDTVDAILENSPIESVPRPLFSFATDNCEDEFYFGQITDITGEGHTFAMEDWRFDPELEGELIFTLDGAIAKVPTMKDLANLMET